MVPVAFKYLFSNADVVLMSHRGWDPGALSVAKILAHRLETPFYHYMMTRLLVEVNRSEHHPELFSEYSATLKKSVKKYLIDKYYHPYRHEVTEHIRQEIKHHDVVHIGVHSFTPVLYGNKRSTDIGLLIDESKVNELAFITSWKEQLETLLPNLQIDVNKPYNGADDGFTTYLRKRYENQGYIGIELEINQKYMPLKEESPIVEALISTLKRMTDNSQVLSLVNNR